MPVFFNKVKRKNPSKPTEPELWYPVLKSTKLVKEKEVAELLSNETTLNPKEAEMAVSQLFKVVAWLLLDGHTVQLGSLGTFRLTAHSRGVPTEAEVNAHLIEKVSVRFSESAELKAAIAKASFVDVSSMSNK
ncbi:MAG: HU family DNA-binding protein [Proteiniphilum sp.]|jgi:predicted histone-like DNA-binding protein|nr:HU family DNA-binding protein [Proteiniphilum sp.]